MKKELTPADLKRGIRIQHLRKVLTYSQEQFAALLEVSRGAVGNWEHGQPCGIKSLTMMSERTGAEFDWLRIGKGKKPETPSDLGAAAVPLGFEFAHEPPEMTPKKVTNRGYVDGDNPGAIADIDTSAGAGAGGYGSVIDSNGALMLHGDAVRGEIVLPDYLLNEYTRTAASRVHSIVVRGDSMEETLRSGDRVFVDTMDTSIGQGGVFVLVDQRSNEVLVKRLRRINSGRQLLIISDNPKQGDPDTVDVNDVFIVGRAVGRLCRL